MENKKNQLPENSLPEARGRGREEGGRLSWTMNPAAGVSHKTDKELVLDPITGFLTLPCAASLCRQRLGRMFTLFPAFLIRSQT